MSHIERTWEDLNKVIQDERFHELGRKDRDTAKMKEHMIWIKDNYIKSVPLTKSTISKDQQKIVLRLNDFPYNTEESVVHWVLWSLQPLSSDEAKQQIALNFGPINYLEDYVFFINPVILQSIKDILYEMLCALFQVLL
eukprot:gene6407-7432_t